ncbi:YlxR family protein [Actinomyces minihominis]|uniref:YlxR family protein n=1 Tax=Actinomyces minihominis TaxID=2002838 RepID=UPI000C076D96|nr:YlxR family protein [Actinomyces minihominis]
MTKLHAPGHVPIRTCVGCGKRQEQAGLVRLVRDSGSVVVDPNKRLPGRGAWLHPDLGCYRKALATGRLARSLRFNSRNDQAWTQTEDFFVANG